MCGHQVHHSGRCSNLTLPARNFQVVALGRDNNYTEIQAFKSFFNNEGVIFLMGGQVLHIIETNRQHCHSQDRRIGMKSKSVFIVLGVFCYVLSEKRSSVFQRVTAFNCLLGKDEVKLVAKKLGRL